MCGFFTAYVCGILFAAVDLLQGISILGFYAFQQYVHRHCTYAHGVLFCEYFLFSSNHSIRTKIGLAEGLICILVSILLIYLIHKRKGMLLWGWLLKPVLGISMNLYFVGDWLVRRGRFYHKYETPEEVEQELLFIYFGAATAALQTLLAFWFCCTAGAFSYYTRRRQRSMYSSCETKV